MVVFAVKLLAPYKNHIEPEGMVGDFYRMCQLRMFFWFVAVHTSCMVSYAGIYFIVARDSR